MPYARRMYRCDSCGWVICRNRVDGHCPKCNSEFTTAECTRCGHRWRPRTPLTERIPKVCPKCKSPYWDRERTKMTGDADE